MPLPFRFLTAALCLVSLLGGCARRAQPDRANTFTHEVRLLPTLPGVSGSSWTLIGARAVALGGTTVSTGQPSRTVYLYDDAAGRWIPGSAELPADAHLARVLATPAGSLLVDAAPGRAPLWLRTGAGGQPELVALPTLPDAFRVEVAAASAGTVYLAGSAGEDARARLLAVEPGGPARSWADLGEIPGELAAPHALVIQSNGERSHLFVLTRTGAGLAISTYEPQRREWRTREERIDDPGEALALPVGIAHLYLLNSDTLRIFNTVTRVWTEPYDLPVAGRPAAASAQGTRLNVLTVDAGAQARLIVSDYQVRAHGLHMADYAVIAGFAVILIAMGLLNSSRFRSAESYFRGGKKIPWLAAGLSVVATGQSATSFISLPARSFATNWQFSLVPLTNVFGALIMSRYFVKFFVRLNITSAYEYLQVRFSPLVRTVGSINYLAYELTRISLLILVPAVAVSAVTRIEIRTAILMMGAIATLYTTLGGLEGVVWADVVQILIKIVAIVLVVVLIFAQLEGSPLELAALAWNEGKLRAVDWSFDLTRDTIWALLLFWLTDGLKSYVANQTIIQRFISTRDERTAQRSVRASAVIGTLIFWTFLLVGTGLYLFYLQNPERLDLTIDKPDAVFPWFIVFELPPGVTGFLITALIAAALSSLYGALNSTSTVMVTDFYRRFVRGASDEGALRLGRRLTLIVGGLATGLSLLLAGLSSRSLVEQTLTVIGLFGGGLGGLFIVGMLTTRVGARSALVGFVTSAAVQYFVSLHTPLHWLTYMFTGMGSCFAAAYLASFVWPDGPRPPGLTVHTCKP